MTRKRRTYNTRLIRRDHSYTIQEVAELFVVHKNAVSRWLKSGLTPIDRSRPVLIHGSTLINYLDGQKAKRRATCQPDEFYCFSCRAPRQPFGRMVDILPRNAKLVSLVAICADCGTAMRRVGSTKKQAIYCQLFETATPAALHINQTPAPSVKCDLEGDTQDAAKHPAV